MACPFFMPTERWEAGIWIHPSRLPLGGGWRGYCTAPGHEGELPTDERLQEGCNLGYATDCPNRPKNAFFDCVRFAVIRESDQRVAIGYVCERNHRPGEHGTLEYDVRPGRWISPHSDRRIQRMAECFLGAHQVRKSRSAKLSTAD